MLFNLSGKYTLRLYCRPAREGAKQLCGEMLQSDRCPQRHLAGLKGLVNGV
jgi:hypothetical protein